MTASIKARTPSRSRRADLPGRGILMLGGLFLLFVSSTAALEPSATGRVVTIVLPFFDDAASARMPVERPDAQVARIPCRFQVLFVDDGSQTGVVDGLARLLVIGILCLLLALSVLGSRNASTVLPHRG